MAAGRTRIFLYDPPIYGVAIGRERHSYQLVKEAGKFAINFVPFEKAELIQQAGVYSGSEHDKFEKSNICFHHGSATNSPVLKDAYIAYECEVIDRHTYGDHDWFVANIVRFYRDDEKFLANGLPDFEAIDSSIYRKVYICKG